MGDDQKWQEGAGMRCEYNVLLPACLSYWAVGEGQGTRGSRWGRGGCSGRVAFWAPGPVREGGGRRCRRHGPSEPGHPQGGGLSLQDSICGRKVGKTRREKERRRR